MHAREQYLARAREEYGKEADQTQPESMDREVSTTVEHTLVELIILATWNIQRANYIEAKLARSEGVDPLLSTSKTIDRIHAFRHRTERSLLKLLKEFQRVKSETPPAKPILQNESSMTAARHPC